MTNTDPLPTDAVIGLNGGDVFTLRDQDYTVRDGGGGWSYGTDRRGDWVRVPVWSPSNGGATTVIVRDRDTIKTERRSER